MKNGPFVLVVLLAMSSAAFAGPEDIANKVADVAKKVAKGVGSGVAEAVGGAAEKTIDAYNKSTRLSDTDITTHVNAKHANIIQKGKNGKIMLGTRIGKGSKLQNVDIYTDIDVRHSTIKQEGEGGEISIGTNIE